MAKIGSIHIQNFKFFGQSEPIPIGGNHLLLYGENGSGKSSLFWALYTLLEAAQKTDEQVIRYFVKDDKAGLVNIHADADAHGGWGSTISLSLTDVSTYRLAINDMSGKKRPNAVATLRGSDFLNYRFMFKLHDCRHRDDIDLFPLFQKEVFPYVSTRQHFVIKVEGQPDNGITRPTQNFNEIWDDLLESQPGPYTDAVTLSDYNKRKQEYARRVKAFSDELNALLTDINSFGNQLLREQLGYPGMRFQVDCPLLYRKDDRGRDDPDEPILPLRIRLAIPEYDNQKKLIHRPQSFLNEAKLTAIGLAIRLAIIRRRLDYAAKADFQLLVLDDLLISLDMSNRRRVLDLLLTDYAPTYQLFILTHDRAFFNFTQRKLKEHGVDKDWQVLEMYQDRLSTYPKPFIAPIRQNLKSARDFFNEHNYPACGLMLRQQCEKVLTELYPESWKYVSVESDGTLKAKDLNGLILSLEDFCHTESIDFASFKPLKVYKDVILNTLAHNDDESPLYADELKAVLLVVEKLSTIKRSQKIIDSAKDLQFVLNSPSGSPPILVRLRTREVLRLLEQSGQTTRLSYFGKCEVRQVDRGSGWVDEHQGYDTLRELIAHYEQEIGVTNTVDLLDLLEYRGQPIRAKLPTSPTVALS